MLVFTIASNHFLEKEVFNELSYFRSTLAMLVGLSTTALGYYILNYSEDISKKEKSAGYNSFIVLIQVISFIIIGIIINLAPNIIGIDKLDNTNSMLLWLMSIVAITFQILLFYARATEAITETISFIILTAGMIILAVILFNVREITHIYYFLTFYYTVILIYMAYKLNGYLSFAFCFTSINKERINSFYLPNFLESLVSVPRTWLSLYILIMFVGISNVGEIILIQMLLGLFIFLCNSFMMNSYLDVTNTGSVEDKMLSIDKPLKIIGFLSLTFILSSSLFWSYIKIALKIDNTSDVQILILCLSSIIQVFLIPLGALYKKNGLSKLTLSHNLIYFCIFVVLEVSLLFIFDINGYYFAYLISWVVIAGYMLYQACLLDLCKVKEYLKRPVFLLVLFCIIFKVAV